MVSRAEVINGLLALFKKPSYLEVGVNKGETFLAIKADRKVAVDPKFLFSVTDAKQTHDRSEFYEVTSDTFFSNFVSPHEVFDLIFLDGLHTFEQTLRDFTNSIRFLAANGIIVIDDVVPNSYQAALPDPADALKVKEYTGSTDNSWMGDTFKLVFLIESFFPTYNFRTISDNHGQAVVWRAAHSRSDFNAFAVREIARLDFIDVIRRSEIFHKAPYEVILDEVRRVIV
jgi:hypothetical protein